MLSEAVEWLEAEEQTLLPNGLYAHGQEHRQGLFQIESPYGGGTSETLCWDSIPIAGTGTSVACARPSLYREMQYTSERLGIVDLSPWTEPDHWRDVL